MLSPYFSVIVTTWNRASLISRALTSLLNQSDQDFEVLIIDDGSTDNTHEIVLAQIKGHSNFKYFLQEHSGSTAAKNKGLSLAKGKWITFLDSDDEYTPEHLELRRKAIEENPGVMLLHGGVKVIGNEYVPDRFNPNKKIHLSECVIGGTFIINRDLIARLGFFKEMELGDDADFFDRVAKEKIPVLKVSYPTYVYYRDTPDSMTNVLM